MALISDSLTTFTVIDIELNLLGENPSLESITFPKALLPTQKLIGNKSINYRKNRLVFEKISRTRPQYFVREGYGAKYGISVGRGNHELSLHNDVKEPFWLAPTKGFISGLKSLFVFLAEQPSQLKYIEWPGFQNTVKTASLTLVLVAMLIVLLSSVDSGLWYLLVKILRKPA